MKEFPQNGGPTVQNQAGLTHPKIDAHGTTDRRPRSDRPKSARTTDNIAVVHDLICSQDDTPHTRVLLYMAQLAPLYRMYILIV